MKKTFKRAVALALASVMALSLAACGGKDSNTGSNTDGANTDTGSSELTSYHIGFNTWGAGSATFDFMANIAEQALEAYDATYSRASDENIADKELQNIQNFVSAGVDGIVMQTAANPVLPQAASECQSGQVPFVMSTFTGDETDRAQISENNPYYVGSVSANMYAEGYLIGQLAAAAGKKTAVLIGGNVGDPHFEMRIEGFTKSFVEEGGGQILNEARCSSPAECQEKANAMLSANSDPDCVYAMAGDYVPGTVSAMETLALDIPICTTNANNDCVTYIRDGRVFAATTGNELVGAIAAALLINYLDGHQILDENGKAPELTTTGFILDGDNIDDYEALFMNDLPYTAETLRTLVWRYNPDVSYDTFIDFIENQLTMEALVAAKNA